MIAIRRGERKRDAGGAMQACAGGAGGYNPFFFAQGGEE